MASSEPDPPHPGLQLQLLGGFSLFGPGGAGTKAENPLGPPAKKSRALLAYLALAGNAAVSREKLSALLWPESAEDQARASLRQALAGLRKLIDDPDGHVLSASGGDLLLDTNTVAVDVRRLEALVQAGGKGDLEQAADLCRGPLLDGLDARADPFEDWLVVERARVGHLMVEALSKLLGLQMEANALDPACHTAHRLLALSPLREEAHRALMRVYERRKRLADALDQYATCERLLQKELGVTPEVETRALRDELLRQRNVQATNSPATSSPPTPQRLPFAPPQDEGKPTIVVMPFEQLDGGDDDSFADGLTEDVTTALSHFGELFVIARNTAFTYKGRATTAEEVGRELSVQYLVCGTVRRAGTRLRLTAQLIDARDGRHIWAQRFDRELKDVFELQDELTCGIVGVLPGRVRDVEARRLARQPPESMPAYELLLSGRIHHHRFTRDDNARASELLDRAIALDPGYAAAWAWKACVLGQAVARGFVPNPRQAWNQGVECAQRALELDANEIECHRILAEIAIDGADLATAERHNARALELNPNDPRLHAQRGELWVWRGRPTEAADAVRNAMRLDPYSASDWSHQLGRALMHLEDHEGAIAAYQTSSYPRDSHAVDMAGCHAALGQQAAADALVQQVLRNQPHFSREAHIRRLPYSNPAARERHLQLLAATAFP